MISGLTEENTKAGGIMANSMERANTPISRARQWKAIGKMARKSLSLLQKAERVQAKANHPLLKIHVPNNCLI